MSFNRLTYDTCAYSKTLQESTDPLEYNLFKGKYESCTNCPDHTNNLEFGPRVDTESDLKGQTRIGTNCPSKKFPLNKTKEIPFTPAITCQGIYKITPTGLPTEYHSGLKDISHYGQDFCPLKK
jgi:hypothetical protein